MNKLLISVQKNTIPLKRYLHISNVCHQLGSSPLAYAPPFKLRSDIRKRIGSREIVGYGMNSMPMYWDSACFPFPSIRFKENNQHILALKEREKGDWKLLSREDKKSLYRASFCLTFSEFQAGYPGHWMEIIGYTLMAISAGIFLFIGIHCFVYDDLPITFTPSYKSAQMRRQIDLRVNPIQGIAANWDYEKMDYKKKRWADPVNPFWICDEDGEYPTTYEKN